MNLSEDIFNYIESRSTETLDLLVELAQIPAPSHREELRAQFCLNWLTKHGCCGAYIDDACNVVYPIGITDSNPLAVFTAHSDVVFPDTTSLPLHLDAEKVFCPGIGDDTANVVMVLMVARYIAENGLIPKDHGVLLVVNSCEEGLGNLKGCRRLLDEFGSRIREFVSFDGGVFTVVNKAVGSRRYRIDITTEGGHSYGCFGNRNAIACMAELITDLYSVQVPNIGKTTYNVGTIEGGTSVNTIAQHAQMLYEFRSDERMGLEIMEKTFRDILSAHREKGICITAEPVGDRPCSADVDPIAEEQLSRRTADAVKKYFGKDAFYGSGSTDCNIPLSLGIPAVCVGCVDGAGAHTREEFIYTDSLVPGLKLAFEMILHHF